MNFLNPIPYIEDALALVDYVQSRKFFGKSIGEWSGVEIHLKTVPKKFDYNQCEGQGK